VRSRAAVAIVALALAALSVAACETKPPDFQSILTTSTTATRSAAPTTPVKPMPFAKYLESIGVTGQPVPPNTLTDLTVSIPTPPGWTPAPNNSPQGRPPTELISKGGKYPAAMLAVFRLQGDFNAADAITHANADVQTFENFKQLEASTADFNGFPSSMIQGSYDLGGTRLHSFNRMVLPIGSGPGKQRYLVQLSITSLANEAVAQAGDIEAIIRGLVVAAK
jgi:Probable lipoprotein LpqN